MAAGVALNLAMLTFYLFATFRTMFHSDCAAKSMLAVEILEQHRFLPPDFWFGRNLWLLHGQVPLLALIPLLGNTFVANAASSALFAAAFVALTALFLRRRGLSWAATVFALLLLTTGFSEYWAAMVYGEAAYGYVCLLVLLGLLVFCELFDGRVRPTARYHVALIAVSLLLGAYGPRGWVTVLAPAAFAALPLATASLARQRRVTVGLAVSAVAAGLLLRVWLLRTHHPLDLRSHLFDLAAGAAGWPPLGLVELFGLRPAQELTTAGPAAILYPARMLALAALGSVTVLASRGLRAQRDDRRLLVYFHWILLALTLYVSVNVRELAGVGRYLIPPVFTAILLAGMAWDQWLKTLRPPWLGAGVCALSLLLSFGAYVLHALTRTAPAPYVSLVTANPLDPVIAELEKRDVHRAYGGFWQSEAMTVLSGAKVVAYPVILQDGIPVPFLHLAADHWYCCAGDHPVALVLSASDVEGLSAPRLAAEIGEPTETVVVGDNTVFLYDADRFPLLAAWQVGNLAAGARASIHLGAAAAGTADGVGQVRDGWLVSGDRAGYLVYGLNARLPAGRYAVQLTLGRTSNGAPGDFWDVALAQGAIVLARDALPAIASDRELQVRRIIEVTPEQAQLPLAVRVYSVGSGLRFRDLVITRLEGGS